MFAGQDVRRDGEAPVNLNGVCGNESRVDLESLRSGRETEPQEVHGLGTRHVGAVA